MEGVNFMQTKLNRGRENKFYTALIIGVAIAFVTFFTSKSWMYDDNPIMQSPYHTPISGLTQTELMLDKWEYSPKKELMEVTIQTKHTGSDPVKPTFAFTAKERGTNVEYPVEVVFNQDEIMVLQIKNVPETYRVVGLFVIEKRDKKVLEQEMKTAYLEKTSGSLDQDNDEEKLTLPEPKQKIIVGDYRKIKTNVVLKKKTGIKYQEENIVREMKQVEKRIDLLTKEQIPLQDQLMKELQNEIKQLEQEMNYQTEEEKQATVTTITSKKEAIQRTEKEKVDYQKEVESLKEKHQKLKEKLQDIRNGTVKKDEKQEATKSTEATNEVPEATIQVNNEAPKEESESIIEN